MIHKDEAIATAEKIAVENSPSKVQILDKFHHIIEESDFKPATSVFLKN
ncbi:hypothetical protein [Virgibacillus proomii]